MEVAQLGPYDDNVDDDDDHDHDDNVDDDDVDNNGATSRHRHSLTPDKLSPGHLSSLQDRPDLQVLSVDPPGHHNLQIWTIYLRILIVRNFDSTIATIEDWTKPLQEHIIQWKDGRWQT